MPPAPEEETPLTPQVAHSPDPGDAHAELGSQQGDETFGEQEAMLAFCLGEYNGRAAAGESINPESYRLRLGPAYSQFLDLLAIDALLDGGVDDPLDKLPRDMGPYTLLRRLGRGAMGIVYEGVHRDLGRRAAIKQLFFPQDDKLRGRFRREARACASIRHDHIVEIYETGEADGQLFYAMEFVEGQSLDSAIKSVDALKDQSIVADQFANVADALNALHGIGIVHRDVKPSNLIYNSGGHLMLADFGLASTAESDALTATGEALGTPLYMSPEQILASHDAVDGRSDVYGLGVTMFETLTGRPPFKPENIRALIKMVATERPPSLRSINPNVAEPLERIVLKCLEKEPDDRYASASELAVDLRAFAAGKSVAGKPVSEWQHKGRALRRHPLLTAATVLAVAGLAALLILKPFSKKTATVRVSSLEGATVSVNASGFVPAPVEVEVDPGETELVLRLAGHKDLRRVFDTEAAKFYDKEFIGFSVLQGASIETLQKLTKVYGWEPVANDAFQSRRFALAIQERTRGVKGEPFSMALVYPRGDVRIEDMQTLAGQYLGEDVPQGNFEIRRGNEVLLKVDNDDVVGMAWSVPVPSQVLESLREGDVITWGLYPPKGPAYETKCRVVSPDFTEEWEQVNAKIAETNQPDDAATYFRTNVLVKHGLRTGAALALARARKQGMSSDALCEFELSVLAEMSGDDRKLIERTDLVSNLKIEVSTAKLRKESMEKR